MSLASKAKDVPIRVWLDYWYAQPEIEVLRKRENALKRELELNPLVEHNAITREMHEAELAMVNHLCPGTLASDPQEKLRAWKWVLAQPWGEDLRPAKYKKVHFGSANTQN